MREKSEWVINVILELAALKPGIAFFRDDAFNDDAARINVEQIFKQNLPNTIVKVI